MEGTRSTRWLRIAAAAMIAVGGGAWAVAASEMPARWAGGPVSIRPFMATYSAIVSIAHALLLAALAWAAHTVGAATAPLLLFVAAGSAALMFALSLAGPLGPFAPNAVAVWLLTALVLAPSLLRTFGLWRLVAANGGRPRRAFALACAVADLAVIALALAETPRQVVATVHPTTTLAGLAPTLASTVALVAFAPPTQGDQGA